MKKMIHFRQRILRGPGLRILRDPGRLRHVVLQAMVQTTASHVLRDGELALLMEPQRRHKPRLIKLDSARETETILGRLRHTDVIGQEVGVQLRTSLGGKVTLRRPSLEEYTLLMSRGATPSYCSVIYTAICMLDIGPGSKVVEAGTGSGAMTLHLSRVVGEDGRVFSFEVCPDHLKIARRNVAGWARSWDLSHSDQGQTWPDNITFHSAGVQEARDHLEEGPHVDAVFLDLPHVTSVLTGLVDILQPYGLAVLFLPNITQAVEVDAYIRATGLPLQTEDIVRVCQEHWTVKPSHTKRLVTPDNERANSSEWGSQDSRTEEESIGKESTEVNGAATVSSLSYICRPNHRQSPHSGFLIKTRRLLKTAI